MTKKQIEKIAQQNGIDLSLIYIFKRCGTMHIEMADLPADLAKKNIAYYDETNNQLPEVEKMIKKYNREAKKLLKALNVKWWAFKTGYGAWDHRLGEMSESTKLAFNNID